MAKAKWNKPTCESEILSALKLGDPLTAHEIAGAIGFSYQNIRLTIKRLLDAEVRKIYISGWRDLDLHHSIPLFSLGNKPDAAKRVPRRERSTERLRVWRARSQFRSEEEVEVQLEIERARRAREALSRPVFRHWQDEAFYGPYISAA